MKAAQHPLTPPGDHLAKARLIATEHSRDALVAVMRDPATPGLVRAALEFILDHWTSLTLRPAVKPQKPRRDPKPRRGPRRQR